MPLRSIAALSLFLAAACGVGDDASTTDPHENLGATTQAILSPVASPSFFNPEIGYYCSATYPDTSWTLWIGALGDGNSNPCSGVSGANMVQTGMYQASGQGWNRVDLWCSGVHLGYWVGAGADPFTPASAFADDRADCLFRVTTDALAAPWSRVPFPDPPMFSPPALSKTLHPLPAPDASYTFQPSVFVNGVKSQLSTEYGSTPPVGPVGWQVAVRDPGGNLVASASTTAGSNTGSTTKFGSVPMTSDRRINMASAAKTITAMATVAALQDIATLHQMDPAFPLLATLDSSIVPYLPRNWTPAASVANITFRMLLTHTSGFCPSSTEPAGSGTSYAQMQAMIKNGPQGTLGAYGYCNAAYGLLRIVLPYLVDGPQAYKRFEGDAGKGDTAKIDQLTSMGYRNYVRGRILDPIGLSGVDEFYTYTNVGSILETLYFNSNGLAIYDDLNFPSPLTGGTLSPSMSTWWAKADNQVLASGAGYWSLSAQEYSLLISRFWMGDIVSRANGSCAQALNTSCLSEMVADYSKANETGAQGFGMNVDKMILTADATTRWSYDKNGGGASSTAWITFFNGYTAVFIQNSFPFSIGDTKPEHMLQGVFNAALTKP